MAGGPTSCPTNGPKRARRMLSNAAGNKKKTHADDNDVGRIECESSRIESNECDCNNQSQSTYVVSMSDTTNNVFVSLVYHTYVDFH